jgi:H+-transporting ATPase
VMMKPLPWKWALFVWVYALVWALVNDRVKLVAYWILDRTKAGETPATRARTQPDAKQKAARTAAELKQQIAKRAYELFEKRDGKSNNPSQDWEQANQEKPKSHLSHKRSPNRMK